LWCGDVERPARVGRGIEIIDETEEKPLDPRPGDHCRVVGAQCGRRRDKAQACTLSERSKAPS
jgi:hypothetical protein